MNIDTPLISHIPLLRRLWSEAFGDTEEFLNTFYMTAFHVHRCRCVTVDDSVIAALYWFDCLHMDRPTAYLYAVATNKDFRGQGICHQLMENTHLYLKKLGYEGTILVPGSKNLFAFYESMGYQTCSYIREFSCAGSSEKVQLNPINTTEYARLRRQFFPKGSVIQENENLDFLQTQAKFYAGFGFLLAAREEANSLYGIELLGNVAVAPNIVQTLGYAKGRFRIPGTKEDIPFAMYHPLGNSKLPPPTYFGLGFD